MLTMLGVKMLLPINTINNTLGLMVLGEKESKDMYTNEDIKTLHVISVLSATALENAQLYKNIKEQNTHLEDLLHIKSDFLRVVNHQLNTPISIIRLGLSSINEKKRDT